METHLVSLLPAFLLGLVSAAAQDKYLAWRHRSEEKKKKKNLKE